MSKSTREQVKELREVHPYWSRADIARACVPPVSSQRIGQIEGISKTNYQSKKYKERHKHEYHKKIARMFRNCSLCKIYFAT